MTGDPSSSGVRYRNWPWVVGRAVAAALATLAVWGLAVVFVEQEILSADPWQRLDRWEGGLSGPWVVVAALSVGTPLAVIAVVGVRAARHGRRAFHPDANDRRRRVRLRWIVLGAVLAAGALEAAVDMQRKQVADRARTATAAASVIDVRFVDGDEFDKPRTDLDVTFTARGSIGAETVSKPGRSRAQVEDRVEVSYEPGQPANVEMARRPSAEETAYPVVVAIAVAVLVVALVAALVLTRDLRRSTQRVTCGLRRRAGGCA